MHQNSEQQFCNSDAKFYGIIIAYVRQGNIGDQWQTWYKVFMNDKFAAADDGLL